MDLFDYIQKTRFEIEKAQAELAEKEQGIEMLRKKVVSLSFAVEHAERIHSESNGVSEEGGPYSNCTLLQAVGIILKKKRDWMSAPELSQILLSGGYKTSSGNPPKAFYTMLHQYSQKEPPKILKKGTRFGLLEWKRIRVE